MLANVEILDFESQEKYNDLDQAYSKFTSQFKVPQSNQAQLRAYLSKAVEEIDGKLWLTRKKKVAMIWWTKHS